MDSARQTFTARLASVLASAIAVLLVGLALLSALYLATTDDPGPWDDIGAGGGLIASIVGLFAMTYQVAGRMGDGSTTETSITAEANDAALDLLGLARDLQLRTLSEAELDIDGVRHEVSRLLSLLHHDETAARRLTAARDYFEEIIAESGPAVL